MNAVYPTDSINDSKVGWSNKCTLSTSSPQTHEGHAHFVGWKITEQVSNDTERQFCLHVGATMFSISSEIFTVELRRIAVADYLLRNFCSSLLFLSSSGCKVPIVTPVLDQHIIERSQLKISAEDGTVSTEFKVQKQSADDSRMFLEKTLPFLISTWSSSSIASSSQLVAHWQCVEDQCALREMISSQGISFVADGSILPRAGGDDDRALTGDSAVPFATPASLRATFTLPHRGKISGMIIPKGVTVITGGGYHGKSTILNAIKVGIYNKIPGDGREFVVTCSSAVAIRSEDGRYVSGVNISPFIDNLPEVAKIDPRSFSSNSASGSTSMAANIIEALEFSPDLLLLDEDTCASNFMIRDSRMRSMIANEPITPFIYRVNSLHKEKGISTIVVIGGSGDWFDVQDTTIMMDNYNCLDVSKKARSICKTFCTGRVQFNGRGLVHQLPWPLAEDPAPINFESSSDIGIMKEGRNMARMLCSLKLPCKFNQGGSVTASEDGRSITFRSRSCTDHNNRKKRRIVSSCDEDVQLSDPFCAFGARGLPEQSKGVEGSITVDLSKLEQRISTKGGALGIAFAIIFVHSILYDSERNCSPQSFSKCVCTRGVTERAVNPIIQELGGSSEGEKRDEATLKTTRTDEPSSRVDFEQIDYRLSTLLRRFDSLRGSWHVKLHELDQSKETGIFSCGMPNLSCSAAKLVDSGREQCLEDLEMANKIHVEFLCLQDFTWPRSFEVAASINRMRGSYFTRKAIIN